MTTIYKSFGQALPQFPQVGDQTATRTQASGTTTAQCTPPKCGINIPQKHWTDLASRLCLEQHRDTLGSKYIADVDVSISFKSEADVVGASTLYLVHPVRVGYQLVHPEDQMMCLKEVTIPQKDMTPSSRVDMAYFLGPPSNERQPGNSNNIFALLEYKKFQGLPRDSFKRGMVFNGPGYARAVGNPPFSDEQTNIEMVLKQATHYAGRYHTPFVALCDYSTLILLVMNQVEGFDGGQYTYLTVVENPAAMRKAYLGFLLAARSHAQNNDDWRKSRTGEDLFVNAEEWERKLQSGDLKPNPKRKARNSDPTGDISSSEDTYASVD